MKEILGVKLYSTEEASRMLELSVVTVRLMIRDGRLPANRISKGWAIPEDSIRAFLLGRKPLAGGEEQKPNIKFYSKSEVEK